MVLQPSRQALRARPIASPRAFVAPLDGLDGSELWEAVDGSRANLQRYLPWVPFQTDGDSSLRFAEACAADWDLGRAFRFGLRERGSNRFLGVVGLENVNPLHRKADLGYWLRDDATGLGFMTEGAAVCIEWGLRVLELHRLRVAAATDNHRSLAVIARLGFRFEGIAREVEWCDGRWLDHATFGLLETEWQAPW